MKNRELCGGLLLVGIGLFFGLQSLQYNIGRLEAIGPGLFPLVISLLVVVIGVLNVIRSRLVESVPPSFNVRGIASIIGAIVAFVLLSKDVNMILGIIAPVFIASFGAASFSVRRNMGSTRRR